MDKNAKIYVAGHHGLVGSAIWKNLQEKGYTNLVGRTHKELDLLDGAAVKQFFDEEMPEYVFLAASGEKTALSGQYLHLSEGCRTADERGRLAHFSTGIYQ